MQRRDVLRLLGTLPLGMAAASRLAHAGVDLQALNEDIAINDAAAGYDLFAHFTGALRDTLAGLNDGALTLGDAQGAFGTSMDSWMAVQHLRLGPSQLDAREFRIEYWPDKRNRVDRQLAEALAQERSELLESEGITGTSVALQGFPVLERLLFVDPVAPGTYGAALAASGANLAAITGELARAWQPGSAFLDDLLKPGSSETAYADAAQVTGHFMTALATQLEFVAQRKLLGPLGAAPEEARPRLAESWRSRRSPRNAWINAAALADFFGAGSHSRFAAALQEAGAAETAQEAGGRMIAAGETLALQPGDLFDHVDDPEVRLAVSDAAAWLDDARRLMVCDGAPALGLNLGFNSLDGD
ncbi:MAG: imelysin family protein [Proteobacteria bacterium]|nr:imelysin family protein [Pseudomonadota bacterium]MDA0952961.1 imelysin family protein [Pseudomonadota bacterium]